MTKRLEELFELASNADSSDLTISLPEITLEVTETALSNLEKIETALPQVKGLDDADSELDELAELAVNSFKDLQDLGMQVEPRFCSDIFSAAGTMLGHAITAKTSKINSKLKRLDMQLKKAQLDAKLAVKNETVDNTPVGEGKALDRNELLKMLRKDDDQE